MQHLQKFLVSIGWSNGLMCQQNWSSVCISFGKRMFGVIEVSPQAIIMLPIWTAILVFWQQTGEYDGRPSFKECFYFDGLEFLWLFAVINSWILKWMKKTYCIFQADNSGHHLPLRIWIPWPRLLAYLENRLTNSPIIWETFNRLYVHNAHSIHMNKLVECRPGREWSINDTKKCMLLRNRWMSGWGLTICGFSRIMKCPGKQWC